METLKNTLRAIAKMLFMLGICYMIALTGAGGVMIMQDLDKISSVVIVALMTVGGIGVLIFCLVGIWRYEP